MTAGIAVPSYVTLAAAGRSRRALAALGALARRGLHFRLRCLILGHEDSFARQPRRLMLRCGACGRETVGWAIGPDVPVTTTTLPSSAVRRPAPFDTAVRVGPWTLQRGQGRREKRDRERQRLVAAAARAAESRSADVGSRSLER